MTMKDWQALSKEIDETVVDPAEAMTALAELAAGLFPDGLPELRRVTWDEPDALGSPNQQTVKDPKADAEERLRHAEARFRTLVEQIPAVTFMAVLGEGRNEIYVSPHIETLLGYTQEEWLSDPFLWYYRLHPDDRVLWNQEFARGCRTGGPFRADCRFMSRDDRVVWVHGEARLVRDELGRPMFLQGIAFDISEIKKAESVLIDETVRKTKQAEELAIARRVQTSILPRNLDVAGLEIAAKMIPAEDVGGDYYDVLPTANGAWIGIGDVAGHGLDAGLVMLMVQAAAATLSRTRASATPRDILSTLNEILYDNIRVRLRSDAHVTFTMCRFHIDGTLLFAGAHEDIIVVRAADGLVELLRPPGTWLGARQDIRRVTVDASLKLDIGDVVVLYTDGLTEARNRKRVQFDIERLCESVKARRNESVEAIRDGVFADVEEWSKGIQQDDDRTIVVMRYIGARTASGAIDVPTE
jgi:PAS domain S-box-containing protein